ncbi:RNA 2',3'-cyclic phosphodiesterase [Lachnospiraceae bacterium MD1]|uniref:RNA 2',3'-cyclic phosphodiesterase n=1 Tax=Variimorphobacter saccharofermentans TaxID=2755051 RepID=A0A839JWR9_9FIRM|nr:RNA 2',3'-cyclic phosphodiesterase [Variimorphobacter saccharofermentans]MBB2181684.1 RNA 2',3'-cyclic phosphodiesterase [Variimorphobacter saccharofermentans]
MRLFVAVTFTESIKTAVYEVEERLRQYCNGGTFTNRENLHLTVVFIGETNRIEEVKQAMNGAVSKIAAEPFLITINGLGKFRRNEGDIYWMGIEKQEVLWKLQKALVKELKEAGFYDIDDREYKPHLTLGRRVRVKNDFHEKEFAKDIPSLKMEVGKISLMKSERVNGKLVYTEIYHTIIHC